MARIIGTHRVSVDRVQLIGEAEVAEANMLAVNSTISEASLSGTPVVLKLSESLTVPYSVDFSVSGTATRGIDYELRVGPDFDSALISTADEFRVLVSQDTAVIYVTPKTADDAVEVMETVIITLNEPAEDAVYTIGSSITHTVYIEDAAPAADPFVYFSNSGVSVDEGAAGETTTVFARVNLSRFADGNESVTFVASGTAADPADYILETALTINFSQGQGYADIEMTIVGNDAVTVDRTIVLTLQAAPTNLQLGTLVVNTTTIVEDDIISIYPQIEWSSNTATVDEGAGQVSFPIDIAIAPLHKGVDILVVVAASSADPALDFNIESLSLTIEEGTLSVPLLIEFPVNYNLHMDTELVLTLTSSDALIAGSDTLTITINNITSVSIDGPLLDWEGYPLAPERKQFDRNSPDLQMYTDGVQVVGNNGATAAWYPVTGNDRNNQALMDMALLHADAQWPLNNPLLATDVQRAAVKMGSEHNLVLIQCFDHNLANTLTEQLGGATGDKQFSFNNDSTDSWSIIQDDCILNPNDGNGGTAAPCIRDVVFYGIDPDVPVLFAGISWDHLTGLVDNFRIENLRLRPKSYVWCPFFLTREKLYGTPQGRIKIYDCSGRNYADDNGVLGWGTGTHRRASKWGLRAEGRACWDIRVRAGAPYPFADSNEEHYIYVDDPVGDVTYPELKITALALGLNECGNYFIGIRGLDGPGTEPPGRTAIQVASRRASNPGDQGSGDLTFVRCAARNIGGDIVSGGQGFSVWGHNGRVYIKDCEYTLSSPYTGTFGGLGMLSEVSWASGDSSPHGQYVYESGGAGYLYQMKNVTIDGFLYKVANQHGSRSAMKFFGVQHLKIIKFDLQNDSGSLQINMNARGFPGLGFTETFDIDDLVYPDSHMQAGDAYTGDFSLYPGWDGTPKIFDGYFMNWYEDTSYENGGIAMDSNAIDNYPAIVAGQKVERMNLADMSGYDWPAGVQTPNPTVFPNPRMKSGLTYFADILNETHAVRIDLKYSFMCELRIFHQETGTWDGEAGTTLGYEPGSASPIVLTPPQVVSDAWEGANEGDDQALSYYDLVLVIDSIATGNPSASKTIVIELGAGGPDADYNFPKEVPPVTRVSLSGVAPLSHTVIVVPPAGMWTIQFFGPSFQTPWPGTDYVPVYLHRVNTVNNTDGDQFTGSFTITGTFSGRCSEGAFYKQSISNSGVISYEEQSVFTMLPGENSPVVWVGVTQDPLWLTGPGIVDMTITVPTPVTYTNLGFQEDATLTLT